MKKIIIILLFSYSLQATFNNVRVFDSKGNEIQRVKKANQVGWRQFIPKGYTEEHFLLLFQPMVQNNLVTFEVEKFDRTRISPEIMQYLKQKNLECRITLISKPKV